MLTNKKLKIIIISSLDQIDDFQIKKYYSNFKDVIIFDSFNSFLKGLDKLKENIIYIVDRNQIIDFNNIYYLSSINKSGILCFEKQVQNIPRKFVRKRYFDIFRLDKYFTWC